MSHACQAISEELSPGRSACGPGILSVYSRAFEPVRFQIPRRKAGDIFRRWFQAR